MLIKFETNSYPTIVMFDYVAKKLISLMGHSGTIPSAIGAEDISGALYKLQLALNNEIEEKSSEGNQEDEEDEDYVSLNKRAIPLIELLQSAEKNEESVMWDVA